MIAHYYLNNIRQENGDHEVHMQECLFFPSTDYEYLGYYTHCQEAVDAAKKRYPYRRINGCKFCSLECHDS